jgi:transposase InsO family protein
VSGSWYPNLRAGVVPTGPNQLWVADITYVRLERAVVFLAVVLDVFSRKVIGYAIGPTLDARLPLAALDEAIESRRPPPGCIHHSDRGSQYSSRRYRERLAEAGLLGSMSRAGNPYDCARRELDEDAEARRDLPARVSHHGGRHRTPPTLLGAHLQQPSAALRPELSVPDRLRDRERPLLSFRSNLSPLTVQPRGVTPLHTP